MAASQEQKVDFLLKKIGYVQSKTGIAEDSSISGTKKAPTEESKPSPLVVPGTSIWSDSTLVPSTPPTSNTSYVGIYTAANAFQLTHDNTVAGNRTFIARSTFGNQSASISGDWIDPSFGADYAVQVYKGDPDSGGVSLSPTGSGNSDEWFFDYSSGILNFNGTNVPSGITTTNVYLIGYKYTGAKGARPAAGIATFSTLDVSGVSTFSSNITANGNANITLNLSKLVVDQSTILKHGDSTKFETTGIGVSILNGTSNTATISGPANLVLDPAAVGDNTGDVRIKGNLYVDGTNFIVDSETVTLADHVVGIASTATTDILTDGAGIGIGTNKLFTFDNTNTAFKSTENLNLETGHTYKINGTDVLSNNTLGSGVVNSSLTNLGTLTALDVNGHTELDNVNVSAASTFGGLVDINAGAQVNTLKVEDLTDNRVVIAGTGGELEDSGNLTFNGTLLALTGNQTISGTIDVDGQAIFDDITVSAASTFTGNIDANGDLDVDGHTELDNLNVSGIATFASDVDLNAGLDVDGHTELDNVNVSAASTFGGLVDINAGGQANTFKVEDLTDNRVVIAGTGGELEDSGNLTFNGSLLNVTGQIDATNIVVGSATTITSSGIVAGIVTGTLDNTLTLATSGTGLSGSATYNNSGAATFTVTSNATNANTASTLVARDGSGDFSAGTITATLTGNVTGNLTGTATTATNLANGANITTGTISDDRLPDLITSNVNIASGISSVATLDATNATIDNLTFTSGTAITSIDTDLSSVSSNDDTLASAKAIKTYIDTEVTAQDLDFQADTGGALSIDLDSETLSVVGTSNEIETAGSGNQIQIGLPNEVVIATSLVVGSATTINAAGIIAGVITATTFSGGLETSNLSGTITNAQLAGSIANSKLANSSVSFGGVSVALGAADATPAFDLSDATNYPTSSLTGTITNAQLAGSIANDKLAGSIANDKLSNSSVSFGGVSVSLGAADATPAFDLQDATGYPTSSLTGTITNAQLAGSIADGKLASTFLKNVVEDTTPQLGGNLDANSKDITGVNNLNVSGVSTFQSHIHLGNDDELRLGAATGGDMVIVHDGDHGTIDNNDGNLNIKSEGNIALNPNNTNDGLNVINQGAVELFHNNAKRLETTTTGVKILNGTTATIAGPDEIIIDPATVGDNTGTVRIKGDLFVDGTTTQINSTTLELADFVVGVATTATTDLLTDGAGIGIGSDKTFLYEHNSGTNPSLKSSENLNVASGKGYQINQTEVLNATTLGSNVVSSSLTSVGTLSALTVGGDVSIADKIVHTGDTNTAIRFPAADTITAETGGTEKLRITSGGLIDVSGGVQVSENVTPTSGKGVEIFKTSDTVGNIQAYNRDDSAWMDFKLKGNKIELFTAGSERLLIDASGNVDIGNNDGSSSNTGWYIQPDGTAYVFTDGSTDAVKIFAGSADERITLKGDGELVISDKITHMGDTNTNIRFPAADTFAVETSGSERLRITSGGKVGIGETAPAAELVVKQSGSTFTTQSQTVALFQRSSTTGHGAKIAIVGGNAANSQVNFGDTDSEEVGMIQYIHTDNSFRFTLNGDGEKVRITSTGQVLINSQSASTSDTFLELKNTAAHTELNIISKNDSGALINFGDTDSYNRGRIKYNNNDDSLTFRTLGTDRLGISSTGVITMGTGTNTQIFADGEAQFAANKINFASNGVATMRSTTFKHGSPSTGTCKFTINPENNSQVTLAYDDEGSVVFGTSSDPATQADFSEKFQITSGGQLQATGAADVRLTLGSSGTAGTNDSVHIRADSANLKFMAANGGNTIFEANGTETFQITSAGTIGIGSGTEAAGSYNTVEIYVGATDENYSVIRGKYNRSNEYNRSEVRFGVENNSAGKGFLAFATGNNSATERLRIQSNGQLLFKGTSGDNQFTSRRTNSAGSNGDYFFHLNAQNSDSTTVGSLGFHRDTATDDSRFVILTRNTGGSNTERLRIDSSGNLQRPKSLSQEVSTSVSSVSATSCGSFAKATYRSAYVIAQITQGSSYQVGRYLVIHDGTTATTVEESAIATGDMLGTFEGVISGSNVEFRVTMGSASSATVITKIESIVV